MTIYYLNGFFVLPKWTETGMLLLKYLIELYVTVRGFAFASSCLELYKQSQKTILSKQKALCKPSLTAQMTPSFQDALGTHQLATVMQ